MSFTNTNIRELLALLLSLPGRNSAPVHVHIHQHAPITPGPEMDDEDDDFTDEHCPNNDLAELPYMD